MFADAADFPDQMSLRKTAERDLYCQPKGQCSEAFDLILFKNLTRNSAAL